MELLISLPELLTLIAILLALSIVGAWYAAPRIINALLRHKQERETIAWEKGRDAYFSFIEKSNGKEPRFKLVGTTDEEFLSAGWANEQREGYAMGSIARSRFSELCERGFDWKNRSDLKPPKLFPEKEELDASKEYKTGVWHWVASITGCLVIDAAIVATAAFQPTPPALIWGPFVLLLLYLGVLMSLYDWHCRIIPIELSSICAGLSVVYAVSFYGLNGLLYGVGSAVALAAFFLLMNFINTKRGKRIPMGGGDIALFVSVAVACGAAGPLSVLLALVVWGVSTVGYLMYGIARHKMTHASFIPAGPFITAGFLAGIIAPVWSSLF